jgi:hypothetical protein
MLPVPEEKSDLRKPRVRFREFLLLSTLASLVVAAFVLRAKARYRESAMDHARQAQVARASAKYLKDDLNFSKGQLERQKTTADQARWQARIKQDQADQAKAAAEAERHDRLAEQLARYYEP